MAAGTGESAEQRFTPINASIQKVATGPEYSKDIAFEEARDTMRLMLEGRVDPVQAAVYLIALRMKRETDDENRGSLQAILDVMPRTTADVSEIIDVADPYDGYTRGLTVSPFLPAVFASLGIPSVSHGLERVGPKYGITHRKVLRAAGVNVDHSVTQVARRLEDPERGWGYVDQRAYCPQLHDLVALRQRIVKRPLLTTIEVLTGPVRGRDRTHLMTGYVHKPYPRIYALLARQAGFDSAAIIRGVEGGVIPSLKQLAEVHGYHGEETEQAQPVDPGELGIEQETRAVPLPASVLGAVEGTDDISATLDVNAAANAAAEAGVAALKGTAGPARDALVYGGAIMLRHLRRYGSLAEAGAAVRETLDSGKALAHFEAGATD